MRYLGDTGVLYLILVWLFCTPHGLAVFLFRGQLSRLVVRERPLRTLARGVADFPPATQHAAIMWLMGREEEAILQLNQILSRPSRGMTGFETLLVLADVLVDSKDPRAEQVFTVEAHLSPTDPEPFFGARASR